MSNFSHLDQLLQTFLLEGLPGCAMQIAKQGKVIYEGYFGYADVEQKIPITKDSVFRQASMSKIPLYTTLMMLYERGKFLLSDPIYDYLPEWKHTKKYIKHNNGYVSCVPTQSPITIRDVLSMKCGLPYCNSPAPTNDLTLQSMQRCMQPLWEQGHYTLQEQVRAMSNAVLACEPGEQWIYGFSSEIAAALIEVICGQSIDDVFQELLYEPLGMESTGSRYFGSIEERMVTLYQKKEDGSLIKSNLFDEKHLPGPEHECGWGRLFSTVDDYTKLVSMLANGGVYNNVHIMGRKTIDLMRSNGLRMPFDDPYNAGYGYGYGVRTLIDQEKGNHNGSIGAFGWTGGFGTWCEADPTEEISIVYMHNQFPSGELEFHHRMRTVAYGCIE